MVQGKDCRPECRHGAFAGRTGEASSLGHTSQSLKERSRQVSEEGWTAKHDDRHATGEISRAAAAYAYEAGRTYRQRSLDRYSPPPAWPWDDSWWKPTDRRRDLIKAAALIIAEIERLDRAALKGADHD